MRRTLLVATAAASLVLSVSGTAVADMPSGTCPGDHWETMLFPLDWEPGDPMDPTGQNILFHNVVDGFPVEFGSLEAGVAAFGYSTLEELYAEVLLPGWMEFDRNTDGILCVKQFPSQGNQPEYVANAVDNTSHPGG